MSRILDITVVTASFDDIIEEYIQNGLEKALAKYTVTPGQFRKLIAINSAAASKYTQARIDRADALADQVVNIADTENNWGKARNMIEARKWVAAKLYPKVYSDRLDVHVTETVDIKSALVEARSRVATPYSPLVLDIPPANSLDDLL